MASEGGDEYIILSKFGSNTTHLLTGVQDISFSQNVQEESVMLLGTDHTDYNITGPTTTNLTFSKVFANDDVIDSTLTGQRLSGAFVYGDRAMVFDFSYIVGYSINANIGDVPRLQCSINVLGDLSGDSSNGNLSHVQDHFLKPALKETPMELIPQTGINITYDKSTTLDQVQSFSLSRAFPWEPYYRVGSLNAAQAVLNGPISEEVSIDFEVEDYVFENKTGYNSSAPGASTIRNSNEISLSISSTTGLLKTYTVNNHRLVSENISTRVSDSPIGSLTYRGIRPGIRTI